MKKINLVKYMKPYTKFALLAPIAMVGEVSVDLSQPKLMQKIVDEGVRGSDMQLILHTGILMLVLLILGVCCGTASAAFSGVASQGFSRDVRNDLFRRVMGLSFQQTDKFTTGSLVTRLTADITAVQQMVDFLLRSFVRNIIMFTGGIIMMLQLNAEFGLIIAVALPLEAVIVIMIMRHANPLYSIVASRLDSVNSVMQENVTGARVIKAYVREGYEEKRFGEANVSLMESNLKVLRLMAIMQPVLLIIMNLSVIFVIYIGGWQVEAKDMQVGEVMAAVTYLTQVLHGIMMISMMFQTMSKAAASARRISEVLGSEPVIVDGEGSSAAAEGTVSFRNVTFAYPSSSGLPVISGLSLDIKKGERIAIIGATGSGKSSLVSLIPRFYDPDEGEVLVDGVNVKDYRLDDLRKRVGIVLQKSELFLGTAADNIRWGKKDASDEEIHRAAKISQADEFLSRIPYGYHTVIAEKGASLSGGQKQRLSITRAVLSDPGILIFDDSTSALDLSTEAKLLNGLKENMKGTTVIMIAQRIAGIKDFDRIAVLDHGKLVGCDTHENLLENCDVYKDIYLSQMRTKGGEADAAAAADRT